ncbi:MAG: hypothetical protein ACLTS6_02615 [Anaerobutyricum sp.]
MERFFQMMTEEIMVERAYSIGKRSTEALKKKECNEYLRAGRKYL